ncbi:SDR family NAD(P)-dependent oxidoreductase [Algicella marina]|uniref:SDR family NAD(P)-dependent oxidoreductase n=1 Tax=Algicella marina TaxID=2683284 RepID=A0A6P1SWM2_9RHOB|nr:SDR family oxidoreductase [Algicella marina]QHQ34838.1 SDR family NAD(P)-dependent oxidoreductase [Algicella marina]
MTELQGRIALVTGASRGLGYATAMELARGGAHIIAVARTVGGLEDLADSVDSAGGSSTLVPLDITDDGGVQRMCLAIHERWGGCDFWVHTAIQDSPLSSAASIAPKDLDKAVAANVTAASRLIRMVTPLLVAKGGTAVYCRDDNAVGKFSGSYGATKAAQTSLFESWSAETSQTGPRVVSFSPNPMPTALRARFYPGENPALLSPASDEAKRLLATVMV